jgi:hypothetical protein
MFGYLDYRRATGESHTPQIRSLERALQPRVLLCFYWC